MNKENHWAMGIYANVVLDQKYLQSDILSTHLAHYLTSGHPFAKQELTRRYVTMFDSLDKAKEGAMAFLEDHQHNGIVDFMPCRPVGWVYWSEQALKPFNAPNNPEWPGDVYLKHFGVIPLMTTDRFTIFRSPNAQEVLRQLRENGLTQNGDRPQYYKKAPGRVMKPRYTWQTMIERKLYQKTPELYSRSIVKL